MAQVAAAKAMRVGFTLTAALWAGVACDAPEETAAAPTAKAAPDRPSVAAPRPTPLWSVAGEEPDAPSRASSGDDDESGSSGWMGRSAAVRSGTAVRVPAKSKPTGSAVVVSRNNPPGGAGQKASEQKPQPQPRPQPQPPARQAPAPVQRQPAARAKPTTAPPPAQPRPAAPAQTAARPPAPAPVKPAAPAPAPEPVASAQGEDTPKEAVRVFFEAYAAGDAAGLRSVLLANDPTEHQFLDAMVRTAEAQAKVRKAAAGKYSADAAEAFVLLSPLAPDVLEQAQERIKGETATVNLAESPQPIVLRRSAGRWRLSVWGMMQGSTGAAAERAIKDMLAMAARVDKVGDDIAAGRYKVVADAKAAWMKSMGMEVPKQQGAGR